MCETKKCTKCGEEKPATLEFYYKSRNKLATVCKICANANNRIYKKTEAGKEAIKRYNKSKSYVASKTKYNNSDKGKLCKKEYVENLTDPYMRRVLLGSYTAKVVNSWSPEKYAEMLSMKRDIIKQHRETQKL